MFGGLEVGVWGVEGGCLGGWRWVDWGVEGG